MNRRTPTQSGSSWEERGVYRTEVDIGNPDLLVVSGEEDLGHLISHDAGTYVMRYYRDSRWSDLVAGGVFDLVE